MVDARRASSRVCTFVRRRRGCRSCRRATIVSAWIFGLALPQPGVAVVDRVAGGAVVVEAVRRHVDRWSCFRIAGTWLIVAPGRRAGADRGLRSHPGCARSGGARPGLGPGLHRAATLVSAAAPGRQRSSIVRASTVTRPSRPGARTRIRRRGRSRRSCAIDVIDRHAGRRRRLGPSVKCTLPWKSACSRAPKPGLVCDDPAAGDRAVRSTRRAPCRGRARLAVVDVAGERRVLKPASLARRSRAASPIGSAVPACRRPPADRPARSPRVQARHRVAVGRHRDVDGRCRRCACPAHPPVAGQLDDGVLHQLRAAAACVRPRRTSGRYRRAACLRAAAVPARRRCVLLPAKLQLLHRSRRPQSGSRDVVRLDIASLASRRALPLNFR